jgi:hypothetical protein
LRFESVSLHNPKYASHALIENLMIGDDNCDFGAQTRNLSLFLTASIVQANSEEQPIEQHKVCSNK